MNRVARRKQILGVHRRPPEQPIMAREGRARIARKIRYYLLQLRPVALIAPRWSEAGNFLEEIAADLDPAIRCRIVSAKSMVGRTEREAWNFILHALKQLSFEGADTRPVPMVVDERGFEAAVEHLLYLASQEDVPTALVIQNAEHLPVRTLEVLGRQWVSQQGFNRCTLLVSASVATPALNLADGPWIELEDMSAEESMRRLRRRAGPVPEDMLASAARFCGGIPALVDTIAESLRENRWPTRQGWMYALGAFAEELKTAVQVAMSSPDLADRLHHLRDGRCWAMEPGDRTLLLSGLLRRIPSGGAPKVQIRAPALAQIAGLLEPTSFAWNRMSLKEAVQRQLEEESREALQEQEQERPQERPQERSTRPGLPPRSALSASIPQVTNPPPAPLPPRHAAEPSRDPAAEPSADPAAEPSRDPAAEPSAEPAAPQAPDAPETRQELLPEPRPFLPPLPEPDEDIVRFDNRIIRGLRERIHRAEGEPTEEAPIEISGEATDSGLSYSPASAATLAPAPSEPGGPTGEPTGDRTIIATRRRDAR